MQTKFEVTGQNKKEKVLVASVNLNSLPKIKGKDVVLLVSVGKEKFEGEDLEVQLSFISSTCGHCYVVVADELQRFNNFSENECNAKVTSIEAGNIWIDKYKNLFEKKFTFERYSFIRWEKFITDEVFNLKKQEILSRLESDSDYENALTKSVEEYKNRRENRENTKVMSEIPQEIIYQNGRNYLIEECAVFLLMASKGGNHILYPGAASKMIKETFEKLINPVYKEPLEWISMRFKRVNNKQVFVNETKDLNHIVFFPNMEKINKDIVFDQKKEQILIDTVINVISSYLSFYSSPEEKMIFLQDFINKFQLTFLSDQNINDISEGLKSKNMQAFI